MNLPVNTESTNYFFSASSLNDYDIHVAVFQALSSDEPFVFHRAFFQMRGSRAFMSCFTQFLFWALRMFCYVPFLFSSHHLNCQSTSRISVSQGGVVVWVFLQPTAVKLWSQCCSVKTILSCDNLFWKTKYCTGGLLKVRQENFFKNPLKKRVCTEFEVNLHNSQLFSILFNVV